MSSIFKQKEKLNKGFQAGITTHADTYAPVQPGQVTRNYPRAGFSGASKRDEYLRMKMQFVEQSKGTAVSPFGTIYASDKDFEQILRKRQAEEKANFDAWVGTNFHTNSVTDRDFLQKVYPEYYKARVQEMESKANLALQVKKIDLFGPQNEEDLEVLYLLQTGQVELPKGWDVIGYRENFDAAEEQKKFVKQLWAPKRYFSTGEKKVNSQVGWNPFKTEQGGQGGWQENPTFALNSEIPSAARYPNFLTEAIKPKP